MRTAFINSWAVVGGEFINAITGLLLRKADQSFLTSFL